MRKILVCTIFRVWELVLLLGLCVLNSWWTKYWRTWNSETSLMLMVWLRLLQSPFKLVQLIHYISKLQLLVGYCQDYKLRLLIHREMRASMDRRVSFGSEDGQWCWTTGMMKKQTREVWRMDGWNQEIWEFSANKDIFQLLEESKTWSLEADKTFILRKLKNF